MFENIRELKNKYEGLIRKCDGTKFNKTRKESGENALSKKDYFEHGYEQGKKRAYLIVLGDLDKTQKNKDENNLVCVPQFIVNTMSSYKSLEEMLTEEYYNQSSEEILDDEVFHWIDKNFDTLCKAYLIGYKIEEEPKYKLCAGWLNEPSRYLILESDKYIGLEQVDSAGIFTDKEVEELRGKGVPVDSFSKHKIN